MLSDCSMLSFVRFQWASLCGTDRAVSVPRSVPNPKRPGVSGAP